MTGRARSAIAVLMLAASLGACGEDPNYSAAPFKACLDARGANPTAIEATSADADVSHEVSQLARQAERDNGAVQAFGAADETYPGASEAAFLFFADAAAAERASQRVKDAIDKLEAELAEPTPYASSVQRNLLTVSTRRTGAQQRVIDECLGRSEE